MFGGTFNTQQQQQPPSLFGNSTTGSGLFGGQQQGQQSTSSGLFGQQQPQTTSTIFNQQQPLPSSSSNLFGAQQNGFQGQQSGLFGNQQQRLPQQSGLFGQPTSTGLFQQQQQQAQTGLFGQPPTGLFGNTIGSTPLSYPGGGASSLQPGGGGLFSSQPMLGSQFGGGLQSGVNMQQGQSSLFGVSTPDRGVTSGNMVPGLGMRSPFGLDFQNAPATAQMEILKAQLLAYGIDVNNLPTSLQAVLPRIGNPNIRTLQLLVHLIGRMVNLKERQERDPEMICFVFNKAPSVDMASRQQLICDQQVTTMGAAAAQRLMRAKKMSPEPRTHYYTSPLFGFRGLQQRVKEQAAFFQHFACSLKELQTRQKASHDKFRSGALERVRRRELELSFSQLEAIRQRQAQLRHRVISLIGALEQLALKAQNSDGEEDTASHRLYERLQRQLTSVPNSIQRSIPVLKDRIKGAVDSFPAPKTTTLAAVGRNAQMATSDKNASMLLELLPAAESHHKEIESIKHNLQLIIADLKDATENVA